MTPTADSAVRTAEWLALQLGLAKTPQHLLIPLPERCLCTTRAPDQVWLALLTEVNSAVQESKESKQVKIHSIKLQVCEQSASPSSTRRASFQTKASPALSAAKQFHVTSASCLSWPGLAVPHCRGDLLVAPTDSRAANPLRSLWLNGEGLACVQSGPCKCSTQL